ncbi:MAG TPA: hypothetical protein PK926_01855 [Spirochaetota bacterium]|nr:hypothetical protein [Spirochaetota bacterium]HPI90197.1 hypothetical protein [Spirochaetota bacterium]HPR46517.1 hypothetical protein [Spirochaetota bacterium]
MKKGYVSLLVIIMVAFIFVFRGSTEYSTDVIEKLKISSGEVPEGFVFGKVPGFAKNVLKDNPWLMDRAAIKHLTGRIYPGGDSGLVNKIHMTIIANRDNPFGDDIVCYIIIYNDARTARSEIAKVTEYVGFNSDRSISLARDNMVIYFCVDDINHFHYIREMADKAQSRLESL